MSLPDLHHESDAHVWKVDLAHAGWDRHGSMLNADEHANAMRFHQAQAQCFYRRCRSALRLLLSRHTGQPGASLQFVCDRFGKPELRGLPWRFNLSHSEDKALIAISRHQVGIDLEFMGRADIDFNELIDIVFHPAEKAALSALPEKERAILFYRLWVQKESYAKALGIGLQCFLPAVFFSELAASTARVCDEQANAMTPYHVHFMRPFHGYAASLCLPAADCRIAVFDATPTG